MGYSARRGTFGPIRPVRGGSPSQDDPHDAIDLEFLGLWLGIARLGQRLRDDRGATRPRKQPSVKGPRRKAA
jgi:hypothetical protein